MEATEPRDFTVYSVRKVKSEDYPSPKLKVFHASRHFYIVKDYFARGNFGRVYACLDDNGNPWALKEVRLTEPKNESKKHNNHDDCFFTRSVTGTQEFKHEVRMSEIAKELLHRPVDCFMNSKRTKGYVVQRIMSGSGTDLIGNSNRRGYLYQKYTNITNEYNTQASTNNNTVRRRSIIKGVMIVGGVATVALVSNPFGWGVGLLSLIAGSNIQASINNATSHNDNIIIRHSAMFRDVLKKLATCGAYLHKNNIILCDIKPDNTLYRAGVSSEGIFELSDFGLAVRANDAGQGRHLGGTTMYTAVETRMTGRATTATDVYALGVTLAEWMLGKYPLGLPNGDELSGPDNYEKYLTSPETYEYSNHFSDIFRALQEMDSDLCQIIQEMIGPEINMPSMEDICESRALDITNEERIALIKVWNSLPTRSEKILNHLQNIRTIAAISNINIP